MQARGLYTLHHPAGCHCQLKINEYSLMKIFSLVHLISALCSHSELMRAATVYLAVLSLTSDLDQHTHNLSATSQVIRCGACSKIKPAKDINNL